MEMSDVSIKIVPVVVIGPPLIPSPVAMFVTVPVPPNPAIVFASLVLDTRAVAPPVSAINVPVVVIAPPLSPYPVAIFVTVPVIEIGA